MTEHIHSIDKSAGVVKVWFVVQHENSGTNLDRHFVIYCISRVLNSMLKIKPLETTAMSHSRCHLKTDNLLFLYWKNLFMWL